MLKLYFAFSILTGLKYVYTIQEAPSVITNYGKIEGHFRMSSGGNKYRAFEGIPFALPPTGHRRFEPPMPSGFWQELKATKFKQPCIGHLRTLTERGNYVDGIEDCLYLNVYTPKDNEDTLLPVIFWIYGGAFQYSTLEGTEQSYLIDHEIIFVSINYRHGALGFLSTEDEFLPGNMGLKDQALALRWVSENIEFFGGDPRKIMLAGVSAGGASVHYHYLSPMSRGLFRTGISFSGTAFDPWTQIEGSRVKAYELGSILNCPTNDTINMIECLKKRPAQDIVEAQTDFMPWHLNGFTPFGPVVEKSASKPFIDRSPIKVIQDKDAYDVPWITGDVTEEGLYTAAEFVTNETAFEDLNDNWDSIAPHFLQYEFTIPKEEQSNVAQRIRNHYFGNESITRGNFLTLTHLVSDRIFKDGGIDAAREQARVNKAPVWFYLYAYRATDSLSDTLSGTKENLGVCHADDTLMVLGNSMINPRKTPEDFAMHEKLMEFWLSVARNGVPDFVPNWEPLQPNGSDVNYLHMAGPNDFTQESNNDFGQNHFWDSIEFHENSVD